MFGISLQLMPLVVCFTLSKQFARAVVTTRIPRDEIPAVVSEGPGGAQPE